MLYSLFIYQSDTGILVWEKSFEDKVDADKMQFYSSFFTAIQGFVKEMVRKGSTELNHLEMGKLSIDITKLKKLEMNLVSISDANNRRKISKLHSRVLKMLNQNKGYFIDWSGDVSRFKILDYEIPQIIQEIPGLFKYDSILTRQKIFFNSFLPTHLKITGKQKELYYQEIDFLTKRLDKTTKILKKLEIIEALSEIYKKLNDIKRLTQNQQLKKQYLQELKEIMNKMNLFLKNTKSELILATQNLNTRDINDWDFRQVYINLYSFSSKLQLLGKDKLAQSYKEIAIKFLNKSPELVNNIEELQKEIMNISSDLSDYIPSQYITRKNNK